MRLKNESTTELIKMVQYEVPVRMEECSIRRYKWIIDALKAQTKPSQAKIMYEID